jgi:hypothetical protein
MGTILSACTDRTFSTGLVPMAHLVASQVPAQNDNRSLFPVRPASRRCRSHRPGELKLDLILSPKEREGPSQRIRDLRGTGVTSTPAPRKEASGTASTANQG